MAIRNELRPFFIFFFRQKTQRHVRKHRVTQKGERIIGSGWRLRAEFLTHLFAVSFSFRFLLSRASTERRFSSLLNPIRSSPSLVRSRPCWLVSYVDEEEERATLFFRFLSRAHFIGAQRK